MKGLLFGLSTLLMVALSQAWLCGPVSVALGVAYKAGQGVIALKGNGNPTGIPEFFMDKLICHYGKEMVDQVTVTWDTRPLDHFSAFGKVYSAGSDAQTFCTQVYVNEDKPTEYDEYTMKLLIHEFKHVQQCQEKQYMTLQTFIAYMYDFCDADYSYRDNVKEVAAYDEQNVSPNPCKV